MKQIELDKLQTRLEEFGKKLSTEQCEEFRQIIWSIGVFHNSVGDIYKYAEIALIPRIKVSASTEIGIPVSGYANTFKPATKQDLTSIAMTLAKNLELNLKKE